MLENGGILKLNKLGKILKQCAQWEINVSQQQLN